MLEVTKMEKLSLQLNGPIKLLELINSKNDNLEKPGLYFWTVKKEEKYLINYVGVSALNIKDRQIQHIKSYLCGDYTIYDAVSLRKGIIKPIYTPNNSIEDLITNMHEYVREIVSNLEIFEYFYTPIEKNKFFLEILESEIINLIRKSNDPNKQFLTNYRLSRLKTEDLKIEIIFESEKELLCLPKVFIL